MRCHNMIGVNCRKILVCIEIKSLFKKKKKYKFNKKTLTFSNDKLIFYIIIECNLNNYSHPPYGIVIYIDT